MIPIARAQMRIRITCPGKEGKKLREKLSTCIASIESEDFSDEYELICLIDPGAFRTIGEILQMETKGRGHFDVLNVKENTKGDVIL